LPGTPYFDFALSGEAERACSASGREIKKRGEIKLYGKIDKKPHKSSLLFRVCFLTTVYHEVYQLVCLFLSLVLSIFDYGTQLSKNGI